MGPPSKEKGQEREGRGRNGKEKGRDGRGWFLPC